MLARTVQQRWLGAARKSFQGARSTLTTASTIQQRDGERVAPDSFERAKRGKFFQPLPQLHNPFVEDPFLRSCLTRMMPQDVVEEVFPDLERFGSRLCEEIDSLGRQAELEPPFLRAYDAWGKRVDDLVTSSAWKRMHEISAEEGLVAIAYERRHKQWSRLHQMSKVFLYAASSGLYSCPLAMTDGATKLIEGEGDEFLRERAYPHLTTRDPDLFWTSGQWMTERQGGSDVGMFRSTSLWWLSDYVLITVLPLFYSLPLYFLPPLSPLLCSLSPPFFLPFSSFLFLHLSPSSHHTPLAGGTETVAIPQSDGSYHLHGYKWFTSATDANMAFTLARVQDGDGLVTEV